MSNEVDRGIWTDMDNGEFRNAGGWAEGSGGAARSGTAAGRAAMEKRLRRSGAAMQTWPTAARTLFY